MIAIAFLVPPPEQQAIIDRLRAQMDSLRPDQARYLEHLIRSWGVFNCADGLALCQRAYRRTLNDRP